MLTLAWDVLQVISFLFLLTGFPLIGTFQPMSKGHPSLPMLINFCHRFGKRGILDLQEMLDAGVSQREICEKYALDKAQLSRYVNHFFRRKFFIYDELKGHLLREIGNEQSRLQPLRLITKDQDGQEEARL